MQCTPVRAAGDVVAVIARESRTMLGRQLGELEDHYLSIFDRFAAMVAEGSFPFREDDDEYEDAPRVGDGVILLEADLRVTFASPNAVSSMHRMGIFSYSSGLRLAEMGFDQEAVEIALRRASSRDRGDRARRHVGVAPGDATLRRRPGDRRADPHPRCDRSSST